MAETAKQTRTIILTVCGRILGPYLLFLQYQYPPFPPIVPARPHQNVLVDMTLEGTVTHVNMFKHCTPKIRSLAEEGVQACQPHPIRQSLRWNEDANISPKMRTDISAHLPVLTLVGGNRPSGRGHQIQDSISVSAGEVPRLHLCHMPRIRLIAMAEDGEISQ